MRSNIGVPRHHCIFRLSVHGFDYSYAGQLPLKYVTHLAISSHATSRLRVAQYGGRTRVPVSYCQIRPAVQPEAGIIAYAATETVLWGVFNLQGASSCVQNGKQRLSGVYVPMTAASARSRRCMFEGASERRVIWSPTCRAAYTYALTIHK